MEGNIVGAEDPKDVGVVEQMAVEETEEDDNADLVEPPVEVNIFGAEDPTNWDSPQHIQPNSGKFVLVLLVWDSIVLVIY